MAKYWITPAGKYIVGYGADIPPQNATEVPSAPDDETDIWDGVKWLPDIAVMKAQANARIIANLAIIDLKSIRSIREWIAAQPTAPTFLKTQEAAAAQERAKLT